VILLGYNSTKISLSFGSRTVGTCQFDVQPHIVYDPIGLIRSVGYLPDILRSIEQHDVQSNTMASNLTENIQLTPDIQQHHI
jgi:hypothetical protein